MVPPVQKGRFHENLTQGQVPKKSDTCSKNGEACGKMHRHGPIRPDSRGSGDDPIAARSLGLIKRCIGPLQQAIRAVTGR